MTVQEANVNVRKLQKLHEMANLYLECVNIISMALRWCTVEEISE